ncbi:bifunctional deaminase-reductase-like protein [Streptomyces gancidicus BKS 13-15]|uniref:Bifunctional deaminase-reductase-like protein n=1 Tax=Streptomyces gancidicus BKS 13-15 TaxID=1284664 RepID=M3DJK8_STREZ|nr:bifunctional deaminase-reductase-like protein [Streptomyces gancidicus BKS 13-15]
MCGVGRAAVTGGRVPPRHQHHRSRQAGRQAEHPVHHGDRQPPSRAETRRAERPRGDALPRPPAAHVQRQAHRQQRQQRERQQLRHRRPGPGDVRGEHEHGHVPGEHHHRRHEHARRGAPREQRLPRLTEQPAHHAGLPPGRRPVHPQGQHHRAGPQQSEPGRQGGLAHLVVDRGGHGQQDRSPGGEQRELPGGPLQHHRPYAPPEVTSVLTVPHGPVHVAEDAAGQRRVEEQRPVVVRHGRAERQPDADAARHQRPAPGAEHGGHQPDAERGGQRGRVDAPHPVDEGAGAEPPEQHGEDDDTGERAEAGAHGGTAEPSEQPADAAPARRRLRRGRLCPGRLPRVRAHAPPSTGRHRASRSVWCTTTRSFPAAQASRRSAR